MAYIPTIKTFEDDINENRRFDEAPISGGREEINYGSNILVSEKKESSLTKKILVFISVLFIAASLALLGYYFYNQYLEKQEERKLTEEASQRQKESETTKGLLSDLEKILPKLSPGIAPYVQTAVQKNNIIILTLKDNDMGVDNFSSIYAYILAHEKDLNSDLFYAFKIEENSSIGNQGFSEEEGFTNPYDFNINTENSPTSTEEVFATSAINLNSDTPRILGPSPIPSHDLLWERKTLYNQDFNTANAGVTSLFYAYINKKYLIITNYLNDFFDTVRYLQ